VPCFEANGTDLRTGDRVTIPPEQWWDLEWFEECCRDAIRANDTHLNGGAQYQDVTVPMRDIVGLWLSGPLPKPQLPDLIRPEGPGYMPLSCAAYWIATEGGAISFDPEDRAVWKRAFDDLLGRIAFEEVQVLGVHHRERKPEPPLLGRIASEEVQVVGVHDGEREPVPPHHFVDLLVSYPCCDDLTFELIKNNELCLWSYPYLDEEHWRNGFDDSLRHHRRPRWSRLMVPKDDIARLWPFGKEAVSRTGAPGRPSCMQYVVEEFERRCQSRQIEASVKQQSEVLHDWVRKEYPHEKTPSPKAIENKIRHSYRHAKSPQK
jgi:hypothetical protein